MNTAQTKPEASQGRPQRLRESVVSDDMMGAIFNNLSFKHRHKASAGDLEETKLHISFNTGDVLNSLSTELRDRYFKFKDVTMKAGDLILMQGDTQVMTGDPQSIQVIFNNLTGKNFLSESYHADYLAMAHTEFLGIGEKNISTLKQNRELVMASVIGADFDTHEKRETKRISLALQKEAIVDPGLQAPRPAVRM